MIIFSCLPITSFFFQRSAFLFVFTPNKLIIMLVSHQFLFFFLKGKECLFFLCYSLEMQFHFLFDFVPFCWSFGSFFIFIGILMLVDVLIYFSLDSETNSPFLIWKIFNFFNTFFIVFVISLTFHSPMDGSFVGIGKMLVEYSLRVAFVLFISKYGLTR